jgi:hypothetical protein
MVAGGAPVQAVRRFCYAPDPSRVPADAPKALAVDEEVPFSHEEIFFSRTNEKGQIAFGNSVFQRVSLYSWAELDGRPHNIIRHPDMPRGVFWLLWNAMRHKQPFGAYIKNKAKDGRYYWVFAIFTAIEGGFLSVRIKPSTEFLPMLAAEYASIVKVEIQQDLKPAAGAQLLLSRLQEFGFQDYASFMAAALSREVRGRDRELGRCSVSSHPAFEELARAAGELLKKANSVSESFAAHRKIPLQLRMRAEELGPDAGVAVIPQNYDTRSVSANVKLPGFLAGSRSLHSMVNESVFLFCVANIQKEVGERFEVERRSSNLTPTGETLLLDQQCRSYQSQASRILCTVASEAALLERMCAELLKAASSLDTNSLLGRSAILRSAYVRAGLSLFLDDLDRQHGVLIEGLKEMLALNRSLQSSAMYLMPRIMAGSVALS